MNHIPKSYGFTIIDNDYKLNNVILSEDLSEVVAVLNWEIVTIAD
jgi:aminoglycoside phosphotransferase (APT) family kinase protein